jgi:hypothetical protein
VGTGGALSGKPKRRMSAEEREELWTFLVCVLVTVVIGAALARWVP